MPEHVLGGCRPTPLACYLKALGVLRLVAEQKDQSARGAWQRERFVVHTQLDRVGLERFFLEEYRPTPIVGPWGARSGFYPDASEKAARAALEEITNSEDARFAPLVEAITVARTLLEALGLHRKEDVDAHKRELMELCRARLPDESVPWLDACFVVLAEDERFPPLLGTGGNEGSGSYMSGFAQQVAACLVRREHDAALGAALWGTCLPSVADDQTSGHFIPNAGGANLSTGFAQEPSMNPWDYLLCLEGTLAFAAAASRRFDLTAPTKLASFPFTVDSSLAGYSTAAAEKARGEMWLPLWSNPSSYAELGATFREGRATIGNRAARDGLDFARAVASLGVDKGIDRFQRFGFRERNGQNNIAVPLGAFPVRSQFGVNRLSEIDGWLSAFRSRVDRTTAPPSARHALRQLEAAIFDLCAHGDRQRLEQVLMALGKAERVMVTSSRWTTESYLTPVPALSPDWLAQTDDGSPEFRLAASLASVYGYYGPYGSTEGEKRTFMPLRRQLEPVQTRITDEGLQVRWDPRATRDVCWTSGHLIDALNGVFRRRLVLAVQAGAGTYPDRGRLMASLGDIADFIEGRTDDSRLSDLLWALNLLDWSRVRPQHLPSRRIPARAPLPGAFYSLLKLCFAGPASQTRSNDESKRRPNKQEPGEVPIVIRIHRLASAGQGAEASAEAIRRLRASGFAPALRPFQVKGEIATRTAAALLFPLSSLDLQFITHATCRPNEAESDEYREQNAATMPIGVTA